MAITYYPFDSGTGASVNETKWAKMATLWRETGIVANQLNEFLVSEVGDSLVASIDTGVAWIEGVYIQSDSAVQVSTVANVSGTNRVDTVCIKVDWTLSDANVTMIVKQGTESPPALTQVTGTMWEFPLAYLTVNAGTSVIASVTDARYFSTGVSAATVPLFEPNGRLTVVSGDPTPADTTGVSTLYYTPYNGNRIQLYNTSTGNWDTHAFTELSLAVNVTNFNAFTDTYPWDIFVKNNSGTLELSAVEWTDETTRTALGTQNGVLVKASDKSYRYVGTVLLVSQTTISDGSRFRGVWNMYNRIPKSLYCSDASNHAPTQTAIRLWNGTNIAGGNGFEWVQGQQMMVGLQHGGNVNAPTTTTYWAFIVIGLGNTPTQHAKRGVRAATAMYTNVEARVPLNLAAGYYKAREYEMCDSVTGAGYYNMYLSAEGEF